MGKLLLSGAAIAAALVAAAPAGATPRQVTGSGITGGHSSVIGSRGSYALAVDGRSGWVRYSDRGDRISFRSTAITLDRDESSPGYPTVAIAGLGTLDGRRVRFYVRCIHSTDNTDISFFIAFRSLTPGYYWDGGGRIHSGTLVIH